MVPRALLLALLLPICSAITWVKSAAGASCDQACAARDGCNDEAWPTSEEEFYDAAKLAGQVCEGTQTGGAKYDPSTDGRYCGWSGPDSMNGESRCSQSGDSGTYRFCPCNADKEL
ncbi:unnamed protein product [Symbiodinium natans]|uniref:Uncharacterized protein n=1 Tax=Symbiodinium natans TaxID=878477 RepID=A0A812R605_9DINO|nr:unnamed protein product [Symbiodinium natans]